MRSHSLIVLLLAVVAAAIVAFIVIPPREQVSSNSGPEAGSMRTPRKTPAVNEERALSASSAPAEARDSIRTGSVPADRDLLVQTNAFRCRGCTGSA